MLALMEVVVFTAFTALTPRFLSEPKCSEGDKLHEEGGMMHVIC